MMEVKHDLLTNKYTKIYCEDKQYQIYNAPHHFKVLSTDNEKYLGEVHFQNGPIKERGVNGVNNEDLLLMVLTRLEAFQKTEFKCKENAEAINKIEEALLWLRKRTMSRENRGVEGTHVV